jgi:hypothetical protein
VPISRDRIHCTAVLACALLSQAVTLGSASAQQAERPTVVAGDRWSFVVYHGLRATVPNRHWVVVAVTPEAIDATEDGQPLRLSLDLNVIESPTRRESQTLALQFPLQVGKSWTYDTETLFKDNRSTARTAAQVRVVAHEPVRVVAGRFDAFKLEARGSFTGLSRGGPGLLSGEFESTYWYAPAAKAIVKSRVWSTYRGTTHTELADVQLNEAARR